MLITPPRPGFQANIQTAARAAGWVPVVGADVGRIEGHTLTVESAQDGRVRWAIEAGAELPQGFAPRLLAKDAFTALREGELLQDGALSWQGRRWALSDTWDGTRLVARLVALA